MRKTFLMFLLVVVSGSAAAAWVEIGGSDNSITYVDPATIRKAGKMVKMWSLMDFKAAQTSSDIGAKSYLSFKAQAEFDCKEEKTRLLFMSSHSGNMGEGEVVDRESRIGTWEPVPPGSVGETLWKFACGKR